MKQEHPLVQLLAKINNDWEKLIPCTRTHIVRKFIPDGRSNIYVDLDVGLIDIDDLDTGQRKYTVSVKLALLLTDVSNISLRLIGCPVIAHGAASGNMHGEICALFYQFKSVGGFDFIADVLIGPKGDKPLGTHPVIQGRYG